MASSKFLSLSSSVVFILFVVLENAWCITTIHHDKPESAQPPAMATQMKKEEIKESLNATQLAASERQKRLLPYMTFYLEHDFNRPQNQVYLQNGQRYQLVIPTKPQTAYQQFHDKFNELTQYGTKYVVETPAGMQPPPKYKPTPFLESNALPGPFLPMRASNTVGPTQTTKVTYTPVRHFETTKVPNYSAIYDKLSQLKLHQQQQQQQQQQNLAQSFNNYNQHYGHQVYPSAQVNYIPVREIPGTNAVVQTYTAASIDIPSGNENYEQISVPVKTYVKNYPAHQDHVQPITEEEQRQYLEDQKYNVEPKKQKQPTVVVVHQKTRLHPQKTYHRPEEQHKQYLQEKPIIIIRKPVPPKPQYTYEVLPEKYENVRYHPLKFDDAPQPPQPPKYVKYQTIPIPLPVEATPDKYVVESVTPKYIDLVPKYEPKPTYAPENIKYEYKYSEPTHHETNFVTAVPTYEAVKFAPTEAPAPHSPDNTNSLSLILKKLQDTNALPHTLTPDNIDNSIRTLVKILSSLKKQQKFSKPIVVPDDSGEYEDDINNEAGVGLGGTDSNSYPENTPEGGTPGKPGVDYPALSSIPQTSFNCKTQRYKGFFGDPDTHCQVWHYCDLNGGQASFLCPNGTIFSQVALTCDWWYNVKCSNTAQQYVLNERLYKYILPLAPKFPEDYSGPLVDRYLALKFQEMEEKMKKERKKNKENSSDEGEENGSSDDEEEEEEEEETDDADELSKEEKRKQEKLAQQSAAETNPTIQTDTN